MQTPIDPEIGRITRTIQGLKREALQSNEKVIEESV